MTTYVKETKITFIKIKKNAEQKFLNNQIMHFVECALLLNLVFSGRKETEAIQFLFCNIYYIKIMKINDINWKRHKCDHFLKILRNDNLIIFSVSHFLHNINVLLLLHIYRTMIMNVLRLSKLWNLNYELDFRLVLVFYWLKY
jgi:hypothetical protein